MTEIGFDIMALCSMLPELILAASGLLLLMVGAFAPARGTSIVVTASAILLVAAFHFCVHASPTPVTVFSGMFESNAFTRFAKALVLISSLLALVLSAPWLVREENRRFEYPVLLLFATLGALLMISAADLIALYVGLELLSLSLYVLASFDRDNAKSSEAGLKYFVLGALASGMMLFGASLIYGFAGTTSFAGLSATFTEAAPSTGVLVGLVLVIVAFCFKISAVPFHMWTPDVYEGAPTPVTVLFATVPKVAALCLFARVLVGPFGSLTPYWQQIVVFVSVLSMMVGAFGAIRQTEFKRLLAYSSIGHVGYALIGIAVGTASGIEGLLIYLTLYVFMSAGTFACILLFRRHDTEMGQIGEIAGLSRNQPAYALSLAIFMFSMAGIPPFSGFFGKFYVFLSAVESGLFLLAVVGVLTSVVACYYYLKIVKIAYFDEPAQPFDDASSYALRYALFATAAVTFLYFAYPIKLVLAARVAAAALFP